MTRQLAAFLAFLRWSVVFCVFQAYPDVTKHRTSRVKCGIAECVGIS